MTTAAPVTRARSPWTPKAAKFLRIEGVLRGFNCYVALKEIICGLREAGHQVQPEVTAMNVGEMVRAGRLSRIGKGRRGDPYLYCLATTETPQPPPLAIKPERQKRQNKTNRGRRKRPRLMTREVALPRPPRPPRPRPEYLPPPAGPDELSQFWQQYSAEPTESRRNALAEHYFPIITATAAAVHSKLPPAIEIDDLISAGSIGLMAAIAAFDLNRGLHFKTYAIARVRGAMLDYLREYDQVPRLVRHWNSKIFKASEELRRKLGREPGIEELASKLSITTAELERQIAENQVVSTVSLNRKFHTPDSFRDIQEIDIIEDKSAIAPIRRLNDLDSLRELTRGLNKSQRIIVIGYYYLGETMWEVAQQLGLSESRVSQMHSMIIAQTKERLSGVPS